MKKEKSKYLLHPSNDMLLNSKILKDINGYGFNKRSTGWLLGIGIATFISLISVNFFSEKLSFGNFSLKKTLFESSFHETTAVVIKTGYEGPLFTQSKPAIEYIPNTQTKLAMEASQSINFTNFNELRNGKSKYERLNDVEIASLYMESGIWPKVPLQAQPPSNVPLGEVYITSIDPSVLSLDAIALDKSTTVSELKALLDIRSPLSIGSSFKLDKDGLAIATEVGALAPAGHQVFAGNPDVVPPEKPLPNYLNIGDTKLNLKALSNLHPKPRPEDKTP